jgi:formylglycine-generating enzyme required for sulfatase activity
VALEEIRGPLEGQNAKLEGIGLELVWIASGKFRMGSDSGERDERPVHDVQISHGFWMGRCEVTNGEYQVFLKATGYDGKWDTDGDYLKHHGDGSSMSTAADYPVCWVSWRNAMAFCVWLTERERAAGRLPKGYKYRLPTEAEWEYAARGGSRSRNYTYAGSNSVDEVAWYSSNAGSATHPVGKKKSNEIGFCDMSGNVWELCLDWFDTEYYKRSPGTDPTNSKSGDGRVVRGGGWNAAADGVRTTGRRWVGLGKTDGDLGFRICLGP